MLTNQSSCFLFCELDLRNECWYSDNFCEQDMLDNLNTILSIQMHGRTRNLSQTPHQNIDISLANEILACVSQIAKLEGRHSQDQCSNMLGTCFLWSFALVPMTSQLAQNEFHHNVETCFALDELDCSCSCTPNDQQLIVNLMITFLDSGGGSHSPSSIQ